MVTGYRHSPSSAKNVALLLLLKAAMSTPNAWDEYRKRRNLAWFAFLGYVPVCCTVAVLSMRLFATFTPAFVVAIGWMVFFLIAGNLVLRFPCPRCGKPFFAKWWYH